MAGDQHEESVDGWPGWLDALFCPPAKITVLTGDSHAGKTRLCLRAVRDASAAGLDVRGVVSPGQYDAAGTRTRIDLLDPSTRMRWLLGESGQPDPVTGRIWRLRPDTTERGADLLASSSGCDLLVVDEIGPDELFAGQGWPIALDVLRAGAYQRALVVVRPRLVETLMQRLQPLRLHVVTLPSGS